LAKLSEQIDERQFTDKPGRPRGQLMKPNPKPIGGVSVRPLDFGVEGWRFDENTGPPAAACASFTVEKGRCMCRLRKLFNS